MASEILPVTGYSSSDSDDEESFVVLSKSTNGFEDEVILKNEISAEALELTSALLHSLQEQEMQNSELPTISQFEKAAENILLSDKESFKATASISSDLSSEDIQQKIDSLISENIKLKDALLQNNLAMKQKYETLVAWYEKVLEVQESHKQKFNETKEYIRKLKEENSQLTQALQISNEKHKGLESKNDSKENPDQEKSQVFLEFKELKVENENLKSEIKKLQEQLKNYSEIQKVELFKSSLDNVKQFEVEMSQKKIVSLENQLAQVQTENDTLKSELVKNTDLKIQLQALKNALAESEFRYEKLKNDSSLQIQNYLTKINKLQEENEILKQNVDTAGKEMYSKTLEQLTAAQMHITELEQLRRTDLEVIDQNQKEIQRLEQMLKDNVSDDENNILRTQMEVFRADFEAERHQKDRYKAEKEQLSEELYHIQRRNEQMLEEIENLRRGNPVAATNSASSGPTAPNEEVSYNYECPKCLFKFKDYQALENHVFRCIELDDQLP